MRNGVLGCNYRHTGAKLDDLGSQKIDVAASYQRIHLIHVAISFDDIERVGADRPGGTEDRERSHCAPVSGHLIIATRTAPTEFWRTTVLAAVLIFWGWPLIPFRAPGR